MTCTFVTVLPQSVRANELELEYKDRVTLLVTQTLQVVQVRTANHLDLLNLN